MVVDTQDNAILTGGFWGRQDLDPGPGEDWHDAGEVPDIYVIKIGPEGALRWAESMGGEDFAHGLGVAADAQDGIYVTGSFRGTVDFDPSEQEDVHTSGGGSDVFLTKFDEAGDYEWTYRIGGPNGESAIGLALDSEGNIFLSGGARVGTDFDPTDGVDIQQPIDGNLDGHSDVFLTRINADLSYAWTRVFGGTESDGARDLAISNHDRLIITGVFRGLDADFDPDDAEDIHKSRGESDNFVTTFTDDGEYLWTRTFGGDWRDESHTVAVDSHGDIYVGGNIRENRDPRIPVDMDPTEGEDYRLPKRTDCFVTKLGADGSYLWSNVWGTESFDEVDSIVLDQCENVIYAGIFWRAGPVDFDPTEGEDLREAIGLFEAFTSKLLPCGNGDANGDCRVTPTDFESTFPCLAGPGVEVSTSCCAFDFDLDGDVDLSDFSVFQELFDTN